MSITLWLQTQLFWKPELSEMPPLINVFVCTCNKICVVHNITRWQKYLCMILWGSALLYHPLEIFITKKKCIRYCYRIDLTNQLEKENKNPTIFNNITQWDDGTTFWLSQFFFWKRQREIIFRGIILQQISNFLVKSPFPILILELSEWFFGNFISQQTLAWKLWSIQF